MNPNIKTLPNGVAVVVGDERHTLWCERHGLIHDRHTADIIFQTMRRKCIHEAVDIGANIGTLTKAMLNTGAKVTAFEPHPHAVECLRINCPEASIVHGGLSDRPGIAFIRNHADNVGASHIGPDTVEGWDCSLTTLDSHRLRPGFVKIDVEGFELKVLRGAKETIAKWHPVMMLEVNAGHLARNETTPQDLFGFLSAYGYKWHIIQSDAKPGDAQYDILASPR